MRRSGVILALALLAACRPGTGHETRESGSVPEDVFALMAEADGLAGEELWPGFDPRSAPVAIFDGDRTFLFRHPAPPDGFEPHPDRHGVWTYPDRYPGVTANSSAEIGGFATATLMPAADASSLRERAGILIHESFHVHQGEHHPGWQANEVELFTYPVDDSALLALRRLETEALRRALGPVSLQETACWALKALSVRGERFARMTPGAAGYERAIELYEGLATYVQGRATGIPDEAVLPEGGYAADAVRLRGYGTGTAFARVLDRLSPGWKGATGTDDSVPLDVRLREAVAPPTDGQADCTFTTPERTAIALAAGADVEILRARRADRRSAFRDQPGWILDVVAPGAPLFPQGFDPLNVEGLEEGEVLHTRWLKLGNQAGAVEVSGHSAMTEAAGDHPLFNGVRRLTVTGLAFAPPVTAEGGVVRVEADGIRAEFRGAGVQREGQRTVIRLPPQE